METRWGRFPICPLLLLLLATYAKAADTIAVLPLFNTDEAQSANLDWIGESAAETIHGSLSNAGLLDSPEKPAPKSTEGFLSARA